ncbi:hypothetical protein TNCV_3830891 [Trichonephila clavipes]|nr:hypothetical protein TNCV_3830891 [Trichonephila clavipes]
MKFTILKYPMAFLATFFEMIFTADVVNNAELSSQTFPVTNFKPLTYLTANTRAFQYPTEKRTLPFLFFLLFRLGHLISHPSCQNYLRIYKSRRKVVGLPLRICCWSFSFVYVLRLTSLPWVTLTRQRSRDVF